MELKKTWKRAISFVLAFAMAFSFTPSVTSRAAAPEDEIVVDATATDVPEAAEAEEFEVETKAVDAAAYTIPNLKITLAGIEKEVTGDDLGVLKTYSYDGQKHTPAVSVKVGNNDLAAGTDYKLSGSIDGEIEVGTYQIQVSFKNYKIDPADENGTIYNGSVSVWYEIVGGEGRVISFVEDSYKDKVFSYGNAVNVETKVTPAITGSVEIEYYDVTYDDAAPAVSPNGETWTKDEYDEFVANRKAKNSVVDAGTYIAVAKVAAEGNYAAVIEALQFEIAPLPLYIVPEKGNGKIYGDGPETIKFKAYTYYNETGVATWDNYRILRDEGTQVNTATRTMVVNGNTVSLDDIRKSEEYPLTQIDQSKAPFLSRDRYNNSAAGFGEAVDSYQLKLNDAEKDGKPVRDTNYVLAKDNWVVAGDEVTTGYKEGQNYMSFVDNETDSSYDLIVDDDEKKLNNMYFTIEKKSFDDVEATFLDDNKDEDYIVTGDVSNYKGDDHEIKFTAVADGNYDDSKPKKLVWHIGASEYKAIVGVYVDGDAGLIEDPYDNGNSENDVNYMDVSNNGQTNKVEITYDGTPHYIELLVKATSKGTGADQVVENYQEEGSRTQDDTLKVYYKNLTTYNKVSFKDGKIDKLEEVKASEDWSRETPRFTEKGIYQVAYKVTSDESMFATVEGTFTIEIKELQIKATAPTVTTTTYPSDATIIGLAEAKQVASTVEVVDKKKDEGKWGDGDNVVGNLWLDYSWNTTGVESTGRTDLVVSPRSYDEEELTALWTEAYDNHQKALQLYCVNTDKAYPTEDDLDVDDCLYLDSYTAYESWDELPEEVRKQLVTFDKLNDDDKKLAKADTYVGADLTLARTLELDQARCLFNKNFNFTTAKGAIVTTMSKLDLELYVGYSEQAKGTVDPFGYEQEYPEYNWKYGTYDSSKSLIKLRYNNNDFGVGGKLPQVYIDNTYYTVLDDGTPVDGFTDIAASEIDKKLMTLPAGDDYSLQATVRSVTGKTNGGTADTLNNEEAYAGFVVLAGKLQIVKDSVVGGKTSMGVAPQKLQNIVVKEIDAKDGLAAGDNTYRLCYALAEDGPFANSLEALEFFDPTIWTTKGKKTIYVMVEPLVNGEPSDHYFEWIDEKPAKAEIEVGATAAGPNDKVADYNVTYLAKDADKVAVAGVSVGADAAIIEKTYGTYTSNKVDAKNQIIYDDDGNYIPVINDNEVPAEGLKEYVANELLYNNGFAVGEQNTYGKYVKNVFSPYMDASKFTYDVVANPDLDHNGYVSLQAETPADSMHGDASVAYYKRDNKKTQNASVGAYRAFDAFELTQGITLYIKEVTNDDGVIALRTVGTDQEPIVSINEAGELTYTLAKELPASGKAKIVLGVSRANFGDIEFAVNITVDAAPPELSVYNVELGKDASSKLQDADDLAVTKAYVNKPLEFTVTAKDVKTNGVYYTFVSKPYWDLFAEEALEETYQLALDDEFDASKNWYAMKGTTIQTPEKDGGYVLYVRAEDESGNVTYASSLTGFTVDTVAPKIVKASDDKFEFGEEAKPFLVEQGADAAIAVLEDTKATVTAALGDAEPVEIKPNDATLNYMLEANEKTYTVKATDLAGNVTVAKIDVNYPSGNIGNKIRRVYVGEDFDLTTVVDKDDETKGGQSFQDNCWNILFLVFSPQEGTCQYKA